MRFAKPARESQPAWRALPKGIDVDRVCSFRYQATVDNDNAVRLAGTILDIPAGPRHRGYAKARVVVRQLLDVRWRVYLKDQLLLETTPPVVQAPLRTVRRRQRRVKTGIKQKSAKPITRIDRLKARLTHDLGLGDT